jgi:TolA-binding protein
MLSKKYIHSFIGLALLLLNFNLFAQKTEINQRLEEHYHRGVELFEKKLYGAAIEEFQYFLNSQKSGQVAENAQLYELLCELRLLHQNADEKLREELKENPENSLNNLAYFEMGNFYFEKRKYKNAIRYFDKVNVSTLSKDMWQEANFKIGYSFFQTEKYDEAKPYFDKVRAQKGTYYIGANYYYGYICYVNKDYNCALKSFEKIKEDGPKIMDLYLAQIYFAQGDYKKALEQCAKVDESKYGDEITLLKGKIHFQLEDYKSALAQFKSWKGNTEDLSTEETYQFAYSNMQSKKYEEAAALFVKISGDETALGQLANYNMGFCFLKSNKKQNAYNSFSIAKRGDYNKEIKEIAHYNYAKLAFELGYQNVAIKTTQDFIAEYPRSEFNDAAKGLLAEMFLQTSNYAQAIAVLDEIKNMNSQTKAAYQKITFKRAEELYNNKEYPEAKSMFGKSLKYIYDKKIEAETFFWLGEVAYKSKAYSEAISQYNRFINNTESKNSKLSNTAFYNMGYAYFMQENYLQALNFFKKYKDQESFFSKAPQRYVDNSLRLADCYFLLSQYEKAADAYGYVVSKQFEGADYALFQQGILIGLMKQPEQKIVLLQKLTNQYPKSIYADDAYFELANTYQDQGNDKQAENAYNQLISKYEESPFIPLAYTRLALIYYNRNMDDRALTYCKTVVDKYPRTESSQDAMRLAEMIYVNSGRGDEYLDWLKTVPNADIKITRQDSLLYESAMTQFRAGDCDKAIKGFNSYIERFGSKGFFLINAHYYAAECENSKKNTAEAIKHYVYVASQSKNEHSENATIKLARLFYADKNFGEAQKYYEQLEKIATSEINYIEGLMGQMRCNFNLAYYPAAKKNAITILPIKHIAKENLIEANMTLGKIQMMDNNLVTAQFHFSYVAKESKNVVGAEAQYNIANIDYLQQKYDSCRERIFDLNDYFSPYEYWVVKGFMLLSDVYVAQKDYFQARATLQGIIDSYKGNKTLLEESKAKLQKVEELEAAEKEAKKTKKTNILPEE